MLLRTQAGVFRPICDVRGNVLALLDESGDIAESYRYDGFGRMRVFDGTGAELTASARGNPFGFACRRYDPTTVLDSPTGRSRRGCWSGGTPSGRPGGR